MGSSRNREPKPGFPRHTGRAKEASRPHMRFNPDEEWRRKLRELRRLDTDTYLKELDKYFKDKK